MRLVGAIDGGTGIIFRWRLADKPLGGGLRDFDGDVSEVIDRRLDSRCNIDFAFGDSGL